MSDLENQHRRVWDAIDAIASLHGMSSSGLARRCGFDKTSFNPSKRVRNGRLHWPSTETIAVVLTTVGKDFTYFAKMVDQSP